MRDTLPLLIDTSFPALKRGSLDTLQVNLGYRCNQRCLHCHVNAGPSRTEMMDKETLDLIVPVMQARGIKQLDLTGGAPELHEHFCDLVSHARAAGISVIDRCNLTILFEPGQEHLAEFLAQQQVEIVASLPCYSLENVDQQRGEGVFDKSIAGLQSLNALGYGKTGSGLTLNLVYNPQGASLPPNQQMLEADYKRELKQHFDIEFNQLFALSNMPIKRFGATLLAHNEFEPYVQLLKDNYQADNLAGVMCRHLISVDWQGNLFDCDFNQQLELGLAAKPVQHLRDLLESNVEQQPIYVADHCYACTAGKAAAVAEPCNSV